MRLGKTKHFITILMMVSLLMSCASGELRIEAMPENSDVFIINAAGNEQRVGSTPLNIASPNLFRSGDLVKLSIRKQGFQSHNVYIPRTMIPSKGELSVSLIESPSSQSLRQTDIEGIANCEAISQSTINTISRAVAAVQTLIMRGEYATAEIRLANLLSEHPYISVLYDLQGNVHYLQKRYDKALTSYETSLKLQPNSVETTFMVKKLREITGQGGS